jgi:hypothetical protein
MPALVDDATDWHKRAQEARELAKQLSDPAARRVVLGLADNCDRLAEQVAAQIGGRSTNEMPCRIILTRAPEKTGA